MKKLCSIFLMIALACALCVSAAADGTGAVTEGDRIVIDNLALLPEGEAAVVYENEGLKLFIPLEYDELLVTVTVRNTGSVPGKEAVQLYLRDPVASVVRPVQQLIDYRKIFLNPGESAEVAFTIREKQLRFFNMDGKEISEPGEFRISTGYADHLILTKSFSLAD